MKYEIQSILTIIVTHKNGVWFWMVVPEKMIEWSLTQYIHPKNGMVT